MVDKILEWLGDRGKLTPAATAMIIVFSMVGTVTLPFVARYGWEMVNKLDTTVTTLSEIKIYMAGATARAAERDRRIDMLEGSAKSQQDQLNNHEIRLTRTETVLERLR